MVQKLYSHRTLLSHLLRLFEMLAVIVIIYKLVLFALLGIKALEHHLLFVRLSISSE